MSRALCLPLTVGLLALGSAGHAVAAPPPPTGAEAEGTPATLLVLIVGEAPSRMLLREIDAADMRKEVESLEKAPSPAYLRLAARAHDAAAIVVVDGAGADLWLPDGSTRRLSYAETVPPGDEQPLRVVEAVRAYVATKSAPPPSRLPAPSAAPSAQHASEAPSGPASASPPPAPPPPAPPAPRPLVATVGLGAVLVPALAVAASVPVALLAPLGPRSGTATWSLGGAVLIPVAPSTRTDAGATARIRPFGVEARADVQHGAVFASARAGLRVFVVDAEVTDPSLRAGGGSSAVGAFSLAAGYLPALGPVRLGPTIAGTVLTRGLELRFPSGVSRSAPVALVLGVEVRIPLSASPRALPY